MRVRRAAVDDSELYSGPRRSFKLWRGGKLIFYTVVLQGLAAVSDAAKQRVAACTHPSVKDSVRKVFDAIAHFVPEGQTATPVIGMDDLAAHAHLHRITVWRNLGDLVDSGEVHILDRTPGRRARYQVVHLAGSAPMTPTPLPLVGAVPPPRPPRRSRRTPDATPTLFDALTPTPGGEQPAINLLHQPVAPVARWWSNLLHLLHVNLLHLLQRRRLSDQPVAREPVAPVAGQGGGVTPRARDVHTFKKEDVHTHTAAPPEPVAQAPPSPTIVHPWHAWCGLVCMPQALHDEWIRKGHDPSWLMAFYPRRCAAIPEGDRITVNDFTFWRAALKDELAAPSARASPTADQPSVEEAVWMEILRRIESTVSRHVYHTWFASSALLAITGDRIQVLVPSEDVATFIRKHHGEELRAAVESVRPGARVELVGCDGQRRQYG